MRVALQLAAACACAAPAVAQRAGIGGGVQAVGVLTHASPMPFDRGLTEARLVQPMGMVDAHAGGWRFTAVADLEGWTMQGGELSPGTWGEGFDDRRHPHTFAHELMLAWTMAPARGVRASLSLGKGFAPFGSDDPMNRPAVLYPVNHHWSQLLERAVLILGVAAGPVTLEAGMLNGDEPERPTSWPMLRGRFGDSWSVRALARLTRTLEVQVSRATVKSPEHRDPPAGPRHEKWSASARYHAPSAGGRRYALLEWSRNSELDGTFVYHSLLGEAEVVRGRHRPFVRMERTERPEEERLLDPFRSQRPHFENSNLGISRWFVGTAGYGFAARTGGVRLEPLVEVSLAHVTMVTPGTVFTPETHFGGNDLVSLTVGLRVGAGMAWHRMGRYGVLAAEPPAPAMDAHHHMDE